MPKYFRKKINWLSLFSKALIIGILTALFKIGFVKVAFGGWGAQSEILDTTFLTTELLDALIFVFLFEIIRRREWRKLREY